ncbi:MAG TPA: hypothetical protein VLI71_07705 [Gammaproteobacteria bacterium]|nr:hypothetical protein [Gammaproteobacteria bacterium]
MEFNGSLAATLALCAVHITVKHWRFLDGPRGHLWLSVAAGTALAYVFTYLLPKLAVIQQEIVEFQGPFSGFLRQQAYLLALIGLLTLFAVDKAAARMPRETGVTLTRGLLLQIVIYGSYSVQLGYLLASFRQPDLATYVLAAAILGLHLMGIDHHIAHRQPLAFSALLRWVFVACCIAGWAIGAFTERLEYAVMLSNTFVAGGIIVIAIREELRDQHSTLLPFFAAVVLASAGIITVQFWQAAH